jgi:hypothetical protein
MKISVVKTKEGWRSCPWMVRYHIEGKTVRRFWKTKEEAEQYAREVRESIRLGADPAELSEAYRLLAGNLRCAVKIRVIKVAYGIRKDRWMVRFYENRRARRKFFRTRKQAERYAQELREHVEVGVPPLDMLEKCARIAAGTGYGWDVFMRAGVESLQRSNAIMADPKATIAEGASRVIARAKSRGCRSCTLKTYQCFYNIINKHFGLRLACSITELELEQFLDVLPNRRGEVGKASPFSQESMTRHFRMALRMLGVQKPLPNINSRIPKEREILHFPIEDVRRILGAARSHERGMVALMVFAGVRPQTAERLSPKDINVADQSILIRASLSKTHRAVYLETIPVNIGTPNEYEFRPGPPPILWVWLKKYPFQACNWRNLQGRLRRALGKKWVYDGLRHTAATFYRAKYGDSRTSDLLGHTTPELVRKHYGGLATRAQAEEFFSLEPDAVACPNDRNANRAKICWPTKEEFIGLVREQPVIRIARKLGCSDTLVLRHCKKLGIATLGRGMWSLKIFNICWPTDNELARLVQEKRIAEIARELRCYPSTVYERCKARGIRIRSDGNRQDDEMQPVAPSVTELDAAMDSGPKSPGNVDTESALTKVVSNSQSETNSEHLIGYQTAGFDSNESSESPESWFPEF